jgi:glycine/D-amino acid oxidase-like deaminating enzyme
MCRAPRPCLYRRNATALRDVQPIIIAGGGPVGVVTALALARQRLEVRATCREPGRESSPGYGHCGAHVRHAAAFGTPSYNATA